MESNFKDTFCESKLESIINIGNENTKYKIKEYSCKKIYQEYINCLSFSDTNQCNKKYLKFMNFCT